MPTSSILWLQQQRRLLELEYEYEKAQFRAQTETIGVTRKIKQGLCWYPLCLGRSYYNSLNQLVIEVERTEYTDTDHGFEPGKQVCFFTQDASGDLRRNGHGGQLHYFHFTGTVSFVDGNMMAVVLPDMEALSHLREDGRIGVQLYLDETTYRLMFEALDRVSAARHGRLAELRDIFHSTAQAGHFSFQPIRFPWLNPTQETAVNEVLRAKDVMIVHGPPGTGKTMLAKAVAGEANVPFFSMSGSEFVEMFVGMGASKVRDLFKQAKEKAPCIVFIDEIDAIGQKRSGGQYGGNDEREQTLNQLLTEMDGFEGNNGVIILAATNRPESLDPALTRPGRFDRRVPVELPDLKGREAILQVHAKKIKVAEDVDFNKIARMASGASGAELANIVNEAALRAVRDGRRFATQADLEESIEVVIAGYQKKNAIMTDEEKKIVSYHEIGHALVAAMQTHSAPVQKITIVPRTSGALGYTMQVEEGNHYLMSKTEMENKIATLTGGRAAEEVVFHSVTTGASNDIEQATKLARAMITRYGMSDDFDMVALETVNNQYLGGDASLACSAETQTKIDQRVVELVKKQHEKAVNILTENRAKLDELAQYLYEKETITGEEFMNIVNAK